MKHTIYNPHTGKIIRLVIVNSSDQLELAKDGNQSIEGHWSDDQYFVQNGQPVKKTKNPSTETLQYDWDTTRQDWTLNVLFSTIKSRQHRDKLLTAIDRINPIWYATLTDQQQQELATYRQALLAVPQQASFPGRVEWPTKPQWL